MKRLTYRLCMVLLGILAGVGTGVVLIPVAYSERGCFAVGGEWIIAIASAALSACAINKSYKYLHEVYEKYKPASERSGART